MHGEIWLKLAQKNVTTRRAPGLNGNARCTMQYSVIEISANLRQLNQGFVSLALHELLDCPGVRISRKYSDSECLFTW